MSRPPFVYGSHSRQCRYTLADDASCRVQADTTDIGSKSPVIVIVKAGYPHAKAAQLLRLMSREIEGQP